MTKLEHAAFFAVVILVGIVCYGAITMCPEVATHYRQCSEITGADVFWFAVVAGVSYYWIGWGIR